MSALTDAGLALASHRYGRAVQLYRLAVTEEPQNALAHQGLGEALRLVDAWQEAMAEAKKALELDANLALPHVTIAMCSYSTRDRETFKTEIQQAYRMDPHLPEALAGYGLMQLDSGNRDAGIEAATRALEIKPDCLLAHSTLVQAYVATRSWSQVTEHQWQVFRLSPSFATGMLLLAHFLFRYQLVSLVIIWGASFAALWLRFPLLLLPLYLYGAIQLGLAYLLLASKKWRPGLITAVFAIVVLVAASMFWASATQVLQ